MHIQKQIIQKQNSLIHKTSQICDFNKNSQKFLTMGNTLCTNESLEFKNQWFEHYEPQRVDLNKKCLFDEIGDICCFQKQIFCKTCSSERPVEICGSCAAHCHKDHNLIVNSERHFNIFLCDCGKDDHLKIKQQTKYSQQPVRKFENRILI
ncbi:hypothetical protein pb186bvf_016212 [Paramecium bursaria]